MKMIALPKKVTYKNKIELYVPSLNLFFSRLLQVYGIKDHQNSANKNNINWTDFFHPFSLYLHLTTLYNLLILLRGWIRISANASVYSSIFTTLLSFIIWYVARAHGGEFHRFLKDCGADFQRKKTPRKYLIIITISAFLMCSLFSIILTLNFVFGDGVKDSDNVQFWFVGSTPPNDELLRNSLLLICVFVYISQQILFPSVLIMFFCVLNIKHTEKVENLKLRVKKSIKFREISLSKQSCLHSRLLLKIKKHEEVFSFLIFLILCLMLALGFTGLALSTQELAQEFIPSESIFYLYFSVISIILITLSASMIQSQLLEIKDFYRMKYESIIEENENLTNLIDEKKIKIIKMMYKRELPYLSAWNIVRLDKNLAFSVFGSLLTYGFLILQPKKND